MFKLMHKDLRSVAPFFGLVLLLYGLHAPINFQLGGAYLFLGIANALTLACLPILVDWHYETESWLRSLPFSRATLVRARYGTAGAALVLGHLLCLGYAAILDRWLDSTQADAAVLFTWEGFAVFTLGVWLPLAVFLPVYFCWGPGKAVPVIVALFVAFVAAPMVFARTPNEPGRVPNDAPPQTDFLPSSRSPLPEPSIPHTGAPQLESSMGLEEPSDSTPLQGVSQAEDSRPRTQRKLLTAPERIIVGQVGAIRDHLGTPLFVGCLAALCLTILGTSLWSSIRAYSRKDL